MPGPVQPALDEATAAARIRAQLSPHGSNRIGVEIEWIVYDAADPSRLVPADDSLAAAATGPLPHGGRVTVEPGGQIELSSAHRATATEAVRVVAEEAGVLEQRCADAGLELRAVGLDPLRSSPLTVRSPRYLAIEQVFDRAGPGPMHMATNSAGLQVNIDLGPDPVDRWRRADGAGPLLTATFANSPYRAGRTTGWASTRQQLWSMVPDRRSAPVSTTDPDAWVDHALDMAVLLILTDDGAEAIVDGTTFRHWIRNGHPLGHPTADDLDYHMTTLWPPVRPRGWLELRMIDSVPATGVAAAAALVEVLLSDGDAGQEAAEAHRHLSGRWADAARHGLSDPEFATAAERCLCIAAAACPDADLAAACEEWADRYPARRRSPAEDVEP